MEAERLWERVKAEIANEGELPRSAYRRWFAVSSSLAIEGNTLLIKLPTLYQANYFRRIYDGAGSVRSAVEKAVGQFMDCRAYRMGCGRTDMSATGWK